MNALEIIALAFIAIGAIKMIVLMFNPKAWYDGLPVKMFKNPGIAYPITLGFAVLVLVYLLETLSIVQIFAAGVFTMLLMMLVMLPFIEGLVGTINRSIDRGHNPLTRAWLGSLVWIVLMVWVLVEIFA